MPPSQPTGPRNLPPPTEPGGVQPVSNNLAQANPQPQPLPSAETLVAQQQAAQPARQAEEDPPSQPTAEPSPSESRQGQPPYDGQSQGTEAEKAREQLEQAIEQSNEILMTAQTVAPVFGDVITIDRAKVTVAKRTFFQTAEVMSIRVEDLLNVTASLGMVFGIVKISNRVAGGDKPTTVGPFWRNDALKLKRITQGYVIALQRSIDVSELSCIELKSMLERLGEDDHPNATTNEPPS